MKDLRVATFGLGCFWEPDIRFSEIPGVEKTVVGYAGGDAADPSYEEVCSGDTGHTEVVQITFDPDEISFDELLKHFWKLHNPTYTAKSQYHSVIFYHNEKQKKRAEKAKKEQEKKLGKQIVTTVEKAGAFYKAEEYHQKYLAKQKKSHTQ